MSSKKIDIFITIGCILSICLMVLVVMYFMPNQDFKPKPSQTLPLTSVNQQASKQNHSSGLVSAQLSSVTAATKVDSNQSLAFELNKFHIVVSEKNTTPEQKRRSLIELLNQTTNPDTQSAVIRFLAMNASLDTTDNILPFLNSQNIELQKDAIDALANYHIEFNDALGSSQLTAQQKLQYKQMAEHIDSALKNLYFSATTSSETKAAIESRFMDLNPDQSLIANVTQSLLKQPLTDSGVEFIGRSLVSNQSDYKTTLNQLGNLPPTEQKRIAEEIQTQLMLAQDEQSPNLAKEQALQINNYVHQQLG